MTRSPFAWLLGVLVALLVTVGAWAAILYAVWAVAR